MSSWNLPLQSLHSTLERAKPQEGLYLVSTPIGNAADISLRALMTLAQVDLIACEDTRVSKKLLSLYAIHTPLLSYHDHNADKQRPKILSHLRSQKTVALISDAGTPLISDPGYKLVQACYQEQIPVTAIPGASAPLMALTVSGLPPVPFVFTGFIPPKSAARRTFFKEFHSWKATLIFFETGSRLAASLQDMLTCLGDRPAVVARELTKKFEEVTRGSLSTLSQRYERDEAPPKGELVIVVEGCLSLPSLTDEEIKERLREVLTLSHSLKDAVAQVSQEYDLPRRRVYKLGLEFSQ